MSTLIDIIGTVSFRIRLMGALPYHDIISAIELRATSSGADAMSAETARASSVPGPPANMPDTHSSTLSRKLARNGDMKFTMADSGSDRLMFWKFSTPTSPAMRSGASRAASTITAPPIE